MRFYVFSVKNDEEFEELRSRGFTGSLNDMQKAFLLNEGLTGALNDLLGSYSGSPAVEGAQFSSAFSSAFKVS